MHLVPRSKLLLKSLSTQLLDLRLEADTKVVMENYRVTNAHRLQL